MPAVIAACRLRFQYAVRSSTEAAATQNRPIVIARFNRQLSPCAKKNAGWLARPGGTHSLAGTKSRSRPELLEASARPYRYAVRISFPFWVMRRRYSRPLWTITSSRVGPSRVSLCTRRS